MAERYEIFLFLFSYEFIDTVKDSPYVDCNRDSRKIARATSVCVYVLERASKTMCLLF